MYDFYVALSQLEFSDFAEFGRWSVSGLSIRAHCCSVLCFCFLGFGILCELSNWLM